MRHQLLSNLLGEGAVQPAGNIDCRQFLVLARAVAFQFRALQLEVGLFGVGL
jgi:hypothetical protein